MRLALEMKGPVYLRLERQKLPLISNEAVAYAIGGSAIMRAGTDATIIATGGMVHRALQAAELLSTEGLSVRVLNMYSIKPIDRKAIIKAAQETRCIVTAEDHNVIGGLGSAVAEMLVTSKPIPMGMVGVQDTFAESGNANELYKKYCLTPEDIAISVKNCINSLGND
jgi:transketolase